MIVVAVFVTVLFGVRVYAYDELTFSAGSANAVTGGGTVTVPIMVNNNPGFTAVGLAVTYDPNVLEITDVVSLATQMPLNAQFALTAVPGTQWIHMVNTSLSDWGGNGPLVNITFNVRGDAPLGVSVIGLGFTNAPSGTPGTSNGVILSGAVTVSGSVTVIEPIPMMQTAVDFSAETMITAQTPITSQNQVPAQNQTPNQNQVPTSEPTPTPVPIQTPEPIPTPVPIQTPEPIPTTTPVQPPSPTPAPTEPPITEPIQAIFAAVNPAPFIGLAYSPETQIASTSSNIGNPTITADFGRVPQTGVSGITGVFIAFAVNFAASIVLWGCVILRKRRDNGNG